MIEKVARAIYKATELRGLPWEHFKPQAVVAIEAMRELAFPGGIDRGHYHITEHEMDEIWTDIIDAALEEKK